MPSISSGSPISCTTAPASTADVDLLIVPWFEGEPLGAFVALDRASGGDVGRALASGEFTGRRFDLFVTAIRDTQWKAARVALVGAGARDGFSPAEARHVATAAALAARQRRVARLGFVIRTGVADASGDVDLIGFAQAVAEGLTLADFNSASYKTGEPSLGPPARALMILSEAPVTSGMLPRVESLVARGRLLGECCNQARGLANEPGNQLTPREFAARATAILAGEAVRVDVLDERQMETLGMGLLLGVARGSSEPPRLLAFTYEPEGAPKLPVLGLVGKGVTFDTGGISIKPADGMERMKDDMAGGAAVVCAMRAIAQLGAPVRVVGVVPATENMPGSRALKPGDVLKSAEGKTVEVINTDAEGRLILGDGLWYARKLGATHLVDVATLTGSIVTALGKITSGIFGTPDVWVDHVRRVADRAGDRAWRMPLFEEYRDQLKSEIADFTNTGGRPAGSITAALFLKEFTGGLPWAHLDIAGTAWIEEARPYLPKGPSGVAVRTLAELACSLDGWA
jgi:leucyl aminopeptidase